MLEAYPVVFREDRNGTVIAIVPDVPGTMTVGGSENEALDRLRGALITMLAGMVEDREPIPAPRRPARGQRFVVLPPVLSAKLSIYRAMIDQGITQVKLARMLGWHDRQVRRLLDVHHNSTLGQIDSALRVLGKQLILDVRDIRAA